MDPPLREGGSLRPGVLHPCSASCPRGPDVRPFPVTNLGREGTGSERFHRPAVDRGFALATDDGPQRNNPNSRKRSESPEVLLRPRARTPGPPLLKHLLQCPTRSHPMSPSPSCHRGTSGGSKMASFFSGIPIVASRAGFPSPLTCSPKPVAPWWQLPGDSGSLGAPPATMSPGPSPRPCPRPSAA